MLLGILSAISISAQTAASDAPKVTQIDTPELAKLAKPAGKPLMLNFWATWCDPCREEFPELVELDHKYKGKIDFITVSLDDPDDIDTAVPGFLQKMKAEMPAYLLRAQDESEAITMIAPDWQGGLPFTILYGADGKIEYFRQGKVKVDVVSAKIDALIGSVNRSELMSLPRSTAFSYEAGAKEAETDFAAGVYFLVEYGLTPGTRPSANRTKRGKINVRRKGGCLTPKEYAEGYNMRMRSLMVEKFGANKTDEALAAAY